MVGFSEVVNFDPEQIREIFSKCSAQQQTCTDLNTHVKKLSDLHTWEGDAAKAAKDSAGKVHGDIASHGHEAWKIAAAARDCYDEGVTLRATARQVLADADANKFAIDPVSGTVTDTQPPNMRGWADADKQSHYAEIKALQARVNKVIADAERFDDDLAAAINAADGSIPLTPDGEGPNVNLADRRANQVAAYRNTYGKDPVTTNDWRMAATLDPHNYQSKTAGQNSVVVRSRITPQPGRGVVTMNAYIPRSKVFNVPEDDLGDGRSTDAGSTPEQNRASITIDYDHGLVVARQNPSVTSGGQVDVGRPDVNVSEQPDGQVNINYRMGNPFAPGPPLMSDVMGETVHGSIALSGGTATPTVNGTMSNYPAVEVFSHPSDGGPPLIAYDYVPASDSNTPFADGPVGPLANLPFEHSAGDPDIFPRRDKALFEFNSDPARTTPLEGTSLSDSADIPHARKVSP